MSFSAYTSPCVYKYMLILYICFKSVSIKEKLPVVVGGLVQENIFGYMAWCIHSVMYTCTKSCLPARSWLRPHCLCVCRGEEKISESVAATYFSYNFLFLSRGLYFTHQRKARFFFRNTHSDSGENIYIGEWERAANVKCVNGVCTSRSLHG